MAPAEWAQIQAAIYAARPRVILEWGSGGSTLELHKMAETVISVEHNPDWFGKVLAELPVDRHRQLRLVPPSEPEPQHDPEWEWRRRAEFEREMFATYVDHPRQLGVQPDVVFADGRARRFCIMEGLRLLRSGGLLIAHDAQRRIYHDVIPKHALFLDGWRQGQVCLIRKH